MANGVDYVYGLALGFYNGLDLGFGLDHGQFTNSFSNFGDC